MDSLRFILIVLGVFIIIAIYLWDRYESRNGIDRLKHVTPPDPDEDSEGLVITTETSYDDDMSTELADLKNFMGDAGVNEIDPFIAHENELEPEREPRDNPFDDVELEEAENSSTGGGEPNEMILVLHVVAGEGYKIDGRQLKSALENLGFEFGEMNIYHYHDDRAVDSEPVFSLVNMYEPGYFDPADMAGFSTGGVSVFARLTTGERSLEIFETMLETSRQLARILGCDLWGPDKHPLTDMTINELRSRLE